MPFITNQDNPAPKLYALSSVDNDGALGYSVDDLEKIEFDSVIFVDETWENLELTIDTQVEPIEVAAVESDGDHTAIGNLFIDAPNYEYDLEIDINPYGSAVYGYVLAWA